MGKTETVFREFDDEGNLLRTVTTTVEVAKPEPESADGIGMYM